MNVWVDDLRPAPDNWVHCLTSEDSITWLEHMRNHGVDFGILSLDHDLGGDDTSRRVAMWLAENDFWPKEIRLHTMNPVGYEYLQGFCNRYAPDDTILEWNRK